MPIYLILNKPVDIFFYPLPSTLPSIYAMADPSPSMPLSLPILSPQVYSAGDVAEIRLLPTILYSKSDHSTKGESRLNIPNAPRYSSKTRNNT